MTEFRIVPTRHWWFIKARVQLQYRDDELSRWVTGAIYSSIEEAIKSRDMLLLVNRAISLKSSSED